MVKQSRELAEKGDIPHARDLLKQALKIDSTNFQVRNMLEKLTTELKPAMKPGTAEVSKTGDSAATEQKKQQTRQDVERRIREIKVKINREKMPRTFWALERLARSHSPWFLTALELRRTPKLATR
jgi:rubrerythrin